MRTFTSVLLFFMLWAGIAVAQTKSPIVNFYAKGKTEVGLEGNYGYTHTLGAFYKIRPSVGYHFKNNVAIGAYIDFQHYILQSSTGINQSIIVSNLINGIGGGVFLRYYWGRGRFSVYPEISMNFNSYTGHPDGNQYATTPAFGFGFQQLLGKQRKGGIFVHIMDRNKYDKANYAALTIGYRKVF